MKFFMRSALHDITSLDSSRTLRALHFQLPQVAPGQADQRFADTNLRLSPWMSDAARPRCGKHIATELSRTNLGTSFT